jgi:solute carrier family 35 protein E3
VFTNKAIFDDDNLKFIQLSFAAFHFSTTWLVLWIISRERFAFFTPKHVSLTQMLPLSVVMTLNIIFPNLSLAFSTVTFYQVARVLVTPCVAILDYVLYKVSVSGIAASTLVVACLGVAMVSYYDSRPSDDANVKTTSQLGIVFALMGVVFSSLYTVWIAAFRKKLVISSMQLLLNQAPLSAFLLLYFIPWVDEFPVINQVSISHWVLIPFVSYSTP